MLVLFQSTLKKILLLRNALDSWSDQSYPLCKTLQDELKIEVFHDLFSRMSQIQLVIKTKCLVPSTYTSFDIFKKEVLGNKAFMMAGQFYMDFESELVQLKEQWIYDTNSFISEAGGALGLMVGFSFIMLWDITEAGIIKLNSVMKTKK